MTPSQPEIAGPAAATSAPSTPGVHVDRLRIGLGEAVVVTVVRQRSNTPLDLSALGQDFEVREANRGDVDGALGGPDRAAAPGSATPSTTTANATATANPDTALERWTLTLYPRSLGRLTLPRWDTGAAPAQLEVTDGSADAPRVRLWWSLAAEPLHERQSNRLTLQACADGALQWQRPLLLARDGALLQPIGQIEAATEVDGLRCTATRWHWALLPTAGGRLAIEAPTLQATRFGTRLRFPGPRAIWAVTPAPAWLPAEVPVGPLRVEAVTPQASERLAIVGEPWPLQLRIQADLSALALRQLLTTQLNAQALEPGGLADPQRLSLGREASSRREPSRRTTEDPSTSDLSPWLRYPMEIVAESVSQDTAHTMTSVRGPAEPHPTPTWRVTLFAVPERAGTLTWPALGWTWFDPATQRLEITRSPALTVTVDDPVRRLWIRALVIIAAALSLALLGFALRHRLTWQLQRWRLASAVRRASTPTELRDQLLSWRPDRPARRVDGSPRNVHGTAPTTLGSWWQAVAAHHRAADPTPWIQPLQRMLYSADADPKRTVPPALRQEVLTWLGTVTFSGRPAGAGSGRSAGSAAVSPAHPVTNRSGFSAAGPTSSAG